MANPEHLAILQQGLAVWNTWREVHWNIHPELASAMLAEANLGEINFHRVDFYRADLHRVHLHKSHFGGAYFNKAALSGADLSGTKVAMELFLRHLAGHQWRKKTR
jgi:uncharacterized protein YjbI with pentapeptide repeats